MNRLFACLLIAAMAVVGQAAIADIPTPKVLVTVEPLKPYIDDILKGVTESTSLLRPNQDPHTAALSPSQALALKEADIIIMSSEAMSPALSHILMQKKKEGARVIELVKLNVAEAKPYPKENPWLTAQKNALKEDKESRDPQDHDHHAHDTDTQEPKKKTKEAALDPHLWLDPIRMAALAAPLANALGEFSPYYRPTFIANAGKLSRHLRTEVDPAIRAMLKVRKNNAPIGNKTYVPFLTYHAAYQYFLARYKLDNAGFILEQPIAYLGAKSLHDTLKGADAINLRCLVSEAETRLVRQISEASGARMVELNPERGYTSAEVGIIDWAKNDYERLLYKVAEGFSSCL